MCVFKRIRKIIMTIVSILSMWRRFFAISLLGWLMLGETALAGTIVPPGNRNLDQPEIPGVSRKRTRDMASSFEAKYQKIYALLKNDAKLRRRIRNVAEDFKIVPVHIVGAIIGEHTYNVDVLDHLQTYYVKGMSWANQGVVFSHQGERVMAFVERPQFESCHDLMDSHTLWQCREDVWNRQFRGQLVDGKRYPDNRFSAVFFQPFFAGQTFGLGQLNPLTALMVSDVHAVSGLPKLDASDGATIYRTIMDPHTTIPYIAAIIRQSIDFYQEIADFDISQNPGITATLYNVGGAEGRARTLARTNKKRRKPGAPLLYPQENYYGWFVNNKIDDLKKLF